MRSSRSAPFHVVRTSVSGPWWPSRFLVLGVLTLLATPIIAWVSVCTRSLIAGCGTALVLIILGQFGTLLGANSGWMPPAVPALWALQIIPTTTPQLLVFPGIIGRIRRSHLCSVVPHAACLTYEEDIV